MKFCYVLSTEKKNWKNNYVLSDCPSLYRGYFRDYELTHSRETVFNHVRKNEMVRWDRGIVNGSYGFA